MSDGGRIQVFTADGVFVDQWGAQGSGVGQLSGNMSLAVDAASNVYIAGGFHRVQKFSSTGEFLAEWSTSAFVVDVAVGVSGAVYIVKGPSGSGSVCKLSANGEAVLEWRGFHNPQGIDVDRFENVHVVDTYNHRIQTFTREGELLCTWGQFGEFEFPTGVAVDHEGSVLIADRNNYRVAKYADVPVPALRATWGNLKTLYR